MKILVVDDDRDFRDLVRILIRREFPNAATVDYDPNFRGPPDEEFPWADYDVVLLDHVLGGSDTGLEWLRRYRRLPDFPPILFVTGEGDEYVAARAVKLGADEYISKRDITAQRLAELITSTMTEHSSSSVESENAPRNTQEREIASPPRAIKLHDSEGGIELDGYVVKAQLGRGASAKVFLAERNHDGLKVVLKVLQHDLIIGSRPLERFMREAKIVAALNCPQVCRIYEQGANDEFAYLVMEYLPGGDLSERISRGVSARCASAYVAYIAQGLAAIHGGNVIHRDLKPANVMFRFDDSLAIADFGISKRLDMSSGLTSVGEIVGTPHYMSPEQAQGHAVDARSDLYSLGVMFYEMLTGQRPYQSDSLTGMIYQHLTAPIPTLEGADGIYQELLNGLMAKAPRDRFASASSVVAFIEKLNLSPQE